MLTDRSGEANFLAGPARFGDGIENFLHDECLVRRDAQLLFAAQMIDEIVEPLLVRHLQVDLEIVQHLVRGRRAGIGPEEPCGTERCARFRAEDLDIFDISRRLPDV